MAFNTALKLAILEAGETQTRVARAAGLSEPRLSRIIRGHGPEPTTDEKAAIADALGRSVHDLFSGAAA